MSQPSKLEPVRTKPRQDVIDILEAALKRARTGEMRGVVIAAELTGNRVNHTCSFNDGILLAGSLQMQLAMVTNAMLHNSIPASPEIPEGSEALLDDETDGDRPDTPALPGSVRYDEEREPD